MPVTTTGWKQSWNQPSAQSLQVRFITLTVGAHKDFTGCRFNRYGTFTDVPAGLAAVNIKLAGYSEVTLLLIYSNGTSWRWHAWRIKQSNIIPMIPFGWRFYCYFARPGYLWSRPYQPYPETCYGVVVLASIDIAASRRCLILQPKLTFEHLPMVTWICMTHRCQRNYSIVVPSTADGLEYDIEVLDFEAQQTLLMPTLNGEENLGVVNVTTRFVHARQVLLMLSRVIPLTSYSPIECFKNTGHRCCYTLTVMQLLNQLHH